MRRPRALASVAALSLVLAACGGGGESTDGGATDADGKGSTDTQEAGGTPHFDLSGVEENPDVAAMVPEGVASDGKLTNGVNANYPPAEFFAEDGTTITGFDIQLADAVARTMGLELDNQQAEFASILPGIGSKYEVGISSFSVTAERMDAVNFAVYLQAGSLWGVRAGNPTDFNPANPCGIDVGVQTGTIQHDALKTKKEECQGKGEDLTITPYTSQQDVTTNLMGGKLDAMFADAPVIAEAISRTNGGVESVGELEEATYVGAVTAKTDEGLALAEAIAAGYQAIIDDGTYGEILDAWGVDVGHLDEALVNPDPEVQ